MHVQVLRCLNIRHAPILDQAHRLKLELPGKPTPLHDPPPAPSKHLTQCLRNRVQAITRSITGGPTTSRAKALPRNLSAERESLRSDHYAPATFPTFPEKE